MSNLIEHAKRELALTCEDPKIVEATTSMIEAFSTCGHSGMSAMFHADMIQRLLRFENLSPLTSDPTEWVQHEESLWQSVRCGEAFTEDGGRTYYLLSERKRRRWPLKGYTKRLHRTTTEGATA